MLNSLVRLWKRFLAWVEQRPAEPTHHRPGKEPYYPSNLHAGRH
jgi:hypothetical protein